MRPALLATSALAALLPGAAPAATVSLGRPVMGTVLEITLVGPDRERLAELARQLHRRAAALEAVVSNWDPDSEISRMNRLAGRGPVRVSEPLHDLLRRCLRLTRETEGAFDITVGSLVELWREAARRGRPPAPAELAAARARVGPGRIELLPDRRVRLAPGTRLELGGVAKGFALDRLAERLGREPVTGALLNLGGSSLRAVGEAPGGGPWRLLLAGPGGDPVGVLALRDRNVSISSSRGEVLQIGDLRVGHILDPRSGEPVPGMRLAAVAAPTGTAAEAWSKALLVLPVERGLARIAARAGAAALVVDAERQIRRTPGSEAVLPLLPLPLPRELAATRPLLRGGGAGAR